MLLAVILAASDLAVCGGALRQQPPAVAAPPTQQAAPRKPRLELSDLPEDLHRKIVGHYVAPTKAAYIQANKEFHDAYEAHHNAGGSYVRMFNAECSTFRIRCRFDPKMVKQVAAFKAARKDAADKQAGRFHPRKR